MCLLISGKSNQIRATLLNTNGLLRDIYGSNSDGLGAMYTTSKRKLRTPKIVPNTLVEAVAFIRQLPDDDRNIAIHWRMRTHGDTDLTNCHPYPVIDGQIALMHNGILSQGNKADTTKSDTWHYIKDVVRPMLELAPKMFTNHAWLSLVEDDITGSNRFAIMDADGDLVILNKDTGIEHEGMWFSNTYAWSPEMLIPGYKKAFSLPKGWNKHWEDDLYDGYYGGKSYGQPVVLAKGFNADEETDPVGGEDDVDEAAAFTADDVWAALAASDPVELCDLLDLRPNFVLRTVMTDCEFVVSGNHDLNKSDERIVKMLSDGEYIPLAKECSGSAWRAEQIAEIMCWYGDWVGKSIDKKGLSLVVAAAEKDVQEELADAAARHLNQLEVADASLDDFNHEVRLALTAGATALNEDYAG